ncbi:MAG: hypothetical protein K2X97_04315 [Mycobacteriaceae bacterium]|nr:hypothetical protein [Mycobacteriaceae bacterium]
MTTHSAPKFPRARNGYEQTAVDEFFWLEAHTKQSLLNDNQLLHDQLSGAHKEIVALKTEVATLYEVSTSPQAVAHRISSLLHTTVDEVANMQSAAADEAAALVNEAQAASEALLSEAQAEAANIVGAARADADKLLAEANASASQLLLDAEREAAMVTGQHISTLQQLAAVHRNLANVPAVLESAYRRRSAHTSPSKGNIATADHACGSTPERRTNGVARQIVSEESGTGSTAPSRL